MLKLFKVECLVITMTKSSRLLQCLRELTDGVSQYRAFAEWTSEFSGGKTVCLSVGLR